VLSAGAILIFVVAGISRSFLYKVSNSSSLPKSFVTNITHEETNEIYEYDCVNESIATVLLDGKLIKLVDLNLPGKRSTLTAGSQEYLVVPNLTQWWFAQKYCIGWCGYLVSIKGPDENEKILGMFTIQACCLTKLIFITKIQSTPEAVAKKRAGRALCAPGDLMGSDPDRTRLPQWPLRA
jgi:hypothetical protein